MSQYLGNTWIDHSNSSAAHEASKLNLAIDKAFHLLNWQPVWNFESTVEKTAVWYTETLQSKYSAKEKTLAQIEEYQEQAKFKNLPWTQ